MPKVDGRMLALFGGRPLFERLRPTGQMYTPDKDAFLNRLDRILAARRFANSGPYQEELEARLADWHMVDHVVAFGNACFALIALMQHVARGDAPDILVPSFSYRGLPHFIQWAGKTPRFADVDPKTHALTAVEAARHVQAGGVAAILAVNNVTGPADLDGLKGLSAETGVPVIYDSVYAIAGTYRGRPLGQYGRAEVFSLHATKLVNGFEGGYVTTNDAELAEALRQIRNFGYDSRWTNILHLGLNGKLNEIHAAMALTSLDGLNTALGHNQAVIARYRSRLAAVPSLRVLGPQLDMIPNDEIVLVDVDPAHPLGRDRLLRVLQAEGALARPYFSPPLHRSKNCPPEALGAALPITDALADRFIQLPTGAFVTEGDADEIADLLSGVTVAADRVAAAFKGLSEAA